MQAFTIRLDDYYYDKLEKMSNFLGMSKQGFCEMAIKKLIKQYQSGAIDEIYDEDFLKQIKEI